MDLRGALLRAAAGRPHVLVIGGLGTERLRARVEQETARRRWPTATSPADADVVVVVGRPGPELRAVIADVWAGVPAPRSQVRIVGEAEVAPALDDAARRLADPTAQRALAPEGGLRAERTDASPTDPGHDGAEHDGAEHAGDDRSADDDHGGGHHHHGGGMDLPGGLTMADLGEDRDGLALDQLHVPLGPVLPDWPSGLVVDVVLQGDVIQDARSRFLDLDDLDATDPAPERLPDAARALASSARVLALAGWDGPAARARGLRDAVLFGGGDSVQVDRGQVLEELDDLRRRVRRSRTLRWVLRSSRAGGSEVVEALDGALLAAGAALRGAAAEPPATVDLPALDARLVGAEFAAARLIVAVADPQPQLTPTPPPDRGGAP